MVGRLAYALSLSAGIFIDLFEHADPTKIEVLTVIEETTFGTEFSFH